MGSGLARQLREACLGNEPRLTVAVAESLTCGRLQAAIGAVSGASDFFFGGLTAYAVEQKIRHLGVDREEAVRTEGVSDLVAAQMAIGACRLFGSDLSASTTGYAEPNPEREFATPTAFFAVARSAGVGEPRIVGAGRIERPGLSRVEMQDAVVEEVLRAMLKAIFDERQ